MDSGWFLAFLWIMLVVCIIGAVIGIHNLGKEHGVQETMMTFPNGEQNCLEVRLKGAGGFEAGGKLRHAGDGMTQREIERIVAGVVRKLLDGYVDEEREKHEQEEKED